MKPKKKKKVKRQKRVEISDDFYLLTCPHCKKPIILDEKKWLSKL